MSARPDWLVPGTEVAYLHSSGGYERVTYSKIDRVLKRDVVLEDGQRFNADTRSKRGSSSWDPTIYLYPRDHERVVAAAKRSEFRSRKARVRAALADADHAINYAKSEDEFGEAVANLIRVLGGDA